MNNIAPISVCLIVKNEQATLENCLKSVRPYVNEIVVVDTGSTDNTVEIAKKYADKIEIYTACNDDNGLIESFSDARQRSFDLASNDWILWLDGDDTFYGGENLLSIVNKYSIKYGSTPFYAFMPYEYSHDNNGNVTCFHYRERLIHIKSAFKWTNPVHEVIIPLDYNNVQNEVNDSVKVIHHRDTSGKVCESGRNFRILKKYYEKHGEEDPRHLYYLGLEYGNNHDIDNGIKFLCRYLELSGWDDEKYMAALKLVDYSLAKGQLNDAIMFAFKAITYKESWFEAYFCLAKIYYMLASSHNEEFKNWTKCAYFAKLALTCPPTKTLLFVNPNDRNVEIHRYLNVALNNTGDVVGALESINCALQFAPNDDQLLFNKKLYEKFLLKKETNCLINKLYEHEFISNDTLNVVSSLLNDSANVVNVTYHQQENYNNKPITVWEEYHKPLNYPKEIKAEDFPTIIVTPHAQAVGIPESFVTEDLPFKMTDKQLEVLVGILYKEYMLHDEVQSAIKLLENAPYRIRHNNFINTLLINTKKTLEWMENDDEAQKTNSPQDLEGNIFDHVMTPFNKELYHSAKARFQWVTDRLCKKNAKILDFGCIDGEFTNRWGLLGYDVTGLDLSKSSVKIANEQAKLYNTGAKHICTYFKDAEKYVDPESFDYITTEDTYEHVQDRINEMLIPARKFVKPDGKMLLVTPHGAWYRGQFCLTAHPWLNGLKGKHWLAEDVYRGHIIAPTVWSVADEFKQAGWYVNTSVVVDQWYQDVPEQGNVCVEASPIAPPGYPRLDIIIYAADCPEYWSPNTADVHGIGGSETAVINMAKGLAKKGNRVRVFSNCNKYQEGIYNGVEYYQYHKFHNLKCDILVVSRLAQGLAEELNVDAKVRLLWVHDVIPKGLTHKLALRADRILALSNWHKENILQHFKYVHKDQVIVTRNGIDLDRFNIEVNRNPHKVVYSSSPDRGLISLLQMWDKIKEKVSDAELHIFYGFDSWEKTALIMNDHNQLSLINSIKEQIKSLSNKDVYLRGRVHQNLLASEFKSSGIWAYSSWFSESSCISAMEAQAAGLYMITSPIAALNETAKNAIFIEGDWLSKEYQSKFIDAVINCADSNKDRNEIIKYAYDNFSWQGVVNDWQKMFVELLEDIETNVVPPFEWSNS